MQQLLIITIIFFVTVAQPMVALAAVTVTTTNNASNRPTYLFHSIEIESSVLGQRRGEGLKAECAAGSKGPIQMPTTQMNNSPIDTHKCFVSFLSVT